MRQHPWLTFWTWLFASLLGMIAAHPFFSPAAPLWFVLVSGSLLYLPIFGVWRIYPLLPRIFRRLWRAHLIGLAATKRQVRYEFIAKERKRRRKATLRAARRAEIERSYRAWRGGGYQPLGTAVDLSQGTPPQQPSAVRIWGERGPELLDLPNFPQGVTIIGMSERHDDAPPSFQQLMDELQERTAAWNEALISLSRDMIVGRPSTHKPLVPLDTPDPRVMPRCKPGKHDWLAAQVVGGGTIKICRLCGAEYKRRARKDNQA